jgi:hypothetical protein
MRRHPLRVIVPVLLLAGTSLLYYTRALRYFYVHCKGIPVSLEKSSYVHSTSACLPEGKALVFVDSENTMGYVVFDKINYNEVPYKIVTLKSAGHVISIEKLTE